MTYFYRNTFVQILHFIMLGIVLLSFQITLSLITRHLFNFLHIHVKKRNEFRDTCLCIFTSKPQNCY